MATPKLLSELAYDQSPYFLQRDCGDLERAKDFAHIFNKAAATCSLQGVYVLRDDSRAEQASVVPVVYVCQADSEQEADAIHRKVWNQNVVPFLVVITRRNIRLYSGFRYHRDAATPDQQGILNAAIAFNEIAEHLGPLRAEAINDGSLWKKWGNEVTPETRVDWRLLDQLSLLDQWLRQQGLDRAISHALIGKFVYLRYLRDREILSDRKLERWNISPQNVFSRNATLKDSWSLIDDLDEWLNGSVFPLTSTQKAGVKAEHLKRVAGTFSGDDPMTGQLHLDFQAYDFSYIPIETLSVIYEQFLHATETDGTTSKGRQAGAYYTPIPLVNFILDELEDQRPLQKGMKVLDPSCGSGAFLVQCYRRLIHRMKSLDSQTPIGPGTLRDLLVKHIFGVDRDPDACRVAELSLTLTLLDYVEPPDLENNPRFKLPALRDRNIFCVDFFDPNSKWATTSQNNVFDWIVGNPPWLEIRSTSINETDLNAWQWMNEHANVCPTGGNQIAEAFAWKALEHVGPKAVVGLLLPAMTLFKSESAEFRRSFFSQNCVWTIGNFSNLAEVLFARRSRRPAIAVFYSPRESSNIEDDWAIVTYSPFVANQQANRPVRAGGRKE